MFAAKTEAPAAAPAAEVVEVTPTIAKEWLAKMPLNRPLSDFDVRKYARDMSRGRWHFTGEPIKFDSDGNLIDGQHRLQAVILSGVTLRILVVRGLATESQHAMDSGRKRSAADALSLNGYANTTTLSSAARLGLGVEAGIGDPGRYDVTHDEVLRYVAENPALIHAVDFTKSLARKTDCPPSVVAYTYFVLSQIDAFQAANFWVAAAEKVGLAKGDPVIALTNRFAESRRNRERFSKAMYLSIIYRAWNFRRAGKTVAFLRVNSSAGGTVPIPEPK